MLLEIHKWLSIQDLPYPDLDWNNWNNIAILKPKLGKTVWTKSSWSDLDGLWEATLDIDMRIQEFYYLGWTLG